MKKRENTIIIVVLVVMVLAIIGVSYAAFNYSREGTTISSITTGVIKMTYTEDDNIISMSGALPTTDATGKVRLTEGEYFDFTVSSEITGNVNINYEISAKDVTSSDAKKIDGSNIKLYLTRLTDDGTEEELMKPEVYNEEETANDYTGRPANEMSLYQGSMNSSESNRYRLRMYVTEEYNPQGDGGGLEFSVQVNVYGKDGNPEDLYKTVAETLLTNNLGNGSTYDDGTDTFITGEDPNNYIWYSGKLWRAVSVNNETKTTKLVTQWNISAITYSSGSTDFASSFMEEWLNDTSVDGFLGNLREPENFIVMDAKWNATMDSTSLGSITRPSDSGTIVTDAVGLLNMYEYQSSNNGGTAGYLNNGLYWWTITPYNSSNTCNVYNNGVVGNNTPSSAYGVRPSINLKSDIKIVNGDGTLDNPYRLNGDNDTNISGTLLNTRYSGEYIRFGNDENNLYRIVSHEIEGLTKITSDESLKDSGTFKTISFGDTATFSSTNTIGTFLNGDYLTNYIGENYSNIIEDSTTWYLGTVGSSTSYRLTKYTDITGTLTTSNITEAKVGLLRYGELMSGQFDITSNNTYYWTLTPYSLSSVRRVSNFSHVYYDTPTGTYGIRPSMNLKSNVIITGGTGTKENPFTLELG